MSGHGTPLWNELSTSDVEAAKAFYARLLGWQYDIMPMPEGDYVVAKAGDAMTGGIMKLPMPEMASQWVPYFHVDDVDAAHAVAAEAGGTTLTPVHRRVECRPHVLGHRPDRGHGRLHDAVGGDHRGGVGGLTCLRGRAEAATSDAGDGVSGHDAGKGLGMGRGNRRSIQDGYARGGFEPPVDTRQGRRHR